MPLLQDQRHLQDQMQVILQVSGAPVHAGDPAQAEPPVETGVLQEAVSPCSTSNLSLISYKVDIFLYIVGPLQHVTNFYS